MYAIKMLKDKLKQIKKAKGIKKYVVKKLKFEMYYNALLNNEVHEITQNLICSKKHKVYTIKQTKKCLDSNDNKRYLIPDTYDTLPWGHKDINKNSCIL